MLATEADVVRTLAGTLSLDRLYALCELRTDVSRDGGLDPVPGHAGDVRWKHRVRGALAAERRAGRADRIGRAMWAIQGTLQRPVRLLLIVAGPARRARRPGPGRPAVGPAPRPGALRRRQRLPPRPNPGPGRLVRSLDRNPGWISASRHALAGVTYGSARLDPIAVHRRAAFNAAATGQYRPAAAEISAAVNEAKDDRVKGWLQEQLASYTQPTDPAQAQQILAGALRLNPRVMRPLEGVSYSRLSPAADQARASADYLAGQYADRNGLIVGVQAVLDDLVFDPEHTDEFEDAVEQLAAHLGFTAQRPERDTNNGPDVLWSTGSLNYLVIECKSGVTTDRIRRSDAAQLAHSMSWFTDQYDQTCRATPVMIHPATVLAADATTPPDTKIITADRLDRLRTAIRGAVIALGDAGTWGDPDAVCAQLTHHRLTGTAIVGAYTVAPRRESPQDRQRAASGQRGGAAPTPTTAGRSSAENGEAAPRPGADETIPSSQRHE